MTVDTAPDAIGAAADWMPGITATEARLLSVWAAFPLLLGGAVRVTRSGCRSCRSTPPATT